MQVRHHVEERTSALHHPALASGAGPGVEDLDHVGELLSRVWRGCRVSPGQRGAGEGCFPYVSVLCLVRASGNVGGVPPLGVDVERAEDLGLEWGAAGDEPDLSACSGDLNVADAAELS